MRIIISVVLLIFLGTAQADCLYRLLASGKEVTYSEQKHGNKGAYTASYSFANHKYGIGFFSLTNYHDNKLLMFLDYAYIDSDEEALNPMTGKNVSTRCEIRTCSKVIFQHGRYVYYPSDGGGEFARAFEKDGEPYAVLRIFTEEPVTSLEELFAGHTCDEPYNEEVYQFLMEAFH